MSDQPQKGGYIKQAWLVLLLALCYGAALAGVQTALGPIIEENKKAEIYSQVPVLVDVDPETTKVETVDVTGKDGKTKLVYVAKDQDGQLAGWVVRASGQGFADKIELLLGLSADLKTITGLYILDQKETPGLGDKIRSDSETDDEGNVIKLSYRDRYKGKSTDEKIRIVKHPAEEGSNQVEAITAATVSSDKVADIVNNAIANLREPLEAKSAELSAAPVAEPAEAN